MSNKVLLNRQKRGGDWDQERQERLSKFKNRKRKERRFFSKQSSDYHEKLNNY